MNILFETTWLAPGGTMAADKVRVNGSQIVDEAYFFRAANAAFFPRGNQSVTLTFVTHWQLSDLTSAEVFVATYVSSLPMGSGDLGIVQLVCGAITGSPQTVYGANAVLADASIIDAVGLSVDVQYTIRIPFFQTDVPPNVPSYPDPNEMTINLRRDSVSIPSSANTMTITFSSPFSTAPIVVASVSTVSGQPAIGGTVLEDTISTSQFTFSFDATIPNGDYWLNYIAVQ